MKNKKMIKIVVPMVIITILLIGYKAIPKQYDDYTITSDEIINSLAMKEYTRNYFEDMDKVKNIDVEKLNELKSDALKRAEFLKQFGVSGYVKIENGVLTLQSDISVNKKIFTQAVENILIAMDTDMPDSQKVEIYYNEFTSMIKGEKAFSEIPEDLQNILKSFRR